MANYEYLSPLRYPGGKASLTQPLVDIIKKNRLLDCTFYEVYAGGAGASLNLLFRDIVSQIFINDVDFHIYAFWHSVLNATDSLIEKVRKTEVSIGEWRKQKKIYEAPEGHSIIEIGFSTLFLNRTNRSGVLSSAGPIGGYEQRGKYGISARFYRDTIIRRIQAIAQRKHAIRIFNKDALEFLKAFMYNSSSNAPSLFFLDPPYFNNGARLYLNHYSAKGHQMLANLLNRHSDRCWVTTYDNVEDIKVMYRDRRVFEFDLNYKMNGPRSGKELMVVSDNMELPKPGWLRCA